jgi:monofunctional glycosyltransferase
LSQVEAIDQGLLVFFQVSHGKPRPEIQHTNGAAHTYNPGLMRKASRWALALAAAGFAYLAYVYLTLPDVRALARTNPTTTAFMELRTREAEAKGRPFRVRQRWVSYSQISNHLKRAVLIAEDSAFFDHEGVDLDQIRESLERNWEEGRFVRGASTITQQLAKNLYLSPSRSPVRKLKELLITRRFEAELSKRRILEIYLNIIEWGDGIFGCETASRAYFGRPAAVLDPSEAALLAAAIINPRELNPARPSRRLVRRQQIILRRMGAGTGDATPAVWRQYPSGDTPADRAGPAVRSAQSMQSEGPGRLGIGRPMSGTSISRTSSSRRRVALRAWL